MFQFVLTFSNVLVGVTNPDQQRSIERSVINFACSQLEKRTIMLYDILTICFIGTLIYILSVIITFFSSNRTKTQVNQDSGEILDVSNLLNDMNGDPLLYIKKYNLVPLEEYIKQGQYDEALQALQIALSRMMKYVDPNVKSDYSFQYEEEIESVFSNTEGYWYAQGLYSIIRNIKELGARIDIEKNLKCAAYGACALFNSISKDEKVPLYFRAFAKKNSML